VHSRSHGRTAFECRTPQMLDLETLFSMGRGPGPWRSVPRVGFRDRFPALDFRWLLFRLSGTWFHCLRLTPDLPFDFAQGRLGLSYAAASRLGWVRVARLGCEPLHGQIQEQARATSTEADGGVRSTRCGRRSCCGKREQIPRFARNDKLGEKAGVVARLEAVPFPFEAAANAGKLLMRSDSSGACRGGSGSGGFR